MATASYMEYFNAMPDDIKEMVYSKITYPQSEELLQEIRDRKIYTVVLKKLGYEKLKPTLDNVTTVLSNTPPIYSIYIMNIILIPDYGIVGAALATTIALLIISCLRFFENYYILNLNVFSLKLIKPIVSGALTIGLIFLSKKYILGLIDYSSSLLNLVLYLLLSIIIVFIGYFSFYIILGIDKEDKDMVDSLKKKIFNQS